MAFSLPNKNLQDREARLNFLAIEQFLNKLSGGFGGALKPYLGSGAFDGDGGSNGSGSETVYTPPAPEPTVPDPIAGASATASMNFVTLSWDMVLDGTVSYEVYEGTTPDFVPDTVDFTNRVAVVSTQVVSIPHDPDSGAWFYKVRPMRGSVFGEFVALNGVNDAGYTLGHMLTDNDVLSGVGAALTTGDLLVYKEALAAGAVDLGDTLRCVGNLAAGRISAGTIDASNVNIVNLNASNITTGNISADRLDTPDALIGRINAGTAKIQSAVIGELTAEQITSGTLTGRTVQTAATGERVVLTKRDIGNGRVQPTVDFYDADGTLAGQLTTSSVGSHKMLAIGDMTFMGVLAVGGIANLTGGANVNDGLTTDTLDVTGTTHVGGKFSAAEIQGLAFGSYTFTNLGYGQTASVDIYFPAGRFVNAPSITAMPNNSQSPAYYTTSIYNVSSTKFTLYCKNNGTSGSGSPTIAWIAAEV